MKKFTIKNLKERFLKKGLIIFRGQDIETDWGYNITLNQIKNGEVDIFFSVFDR